MSRETKSRKKKLVPNVSLLWLNQLKERLVNPYSFSSPKASHYCSALSDRIIQDSLWLGKQQHSA